MYRNVSWSQKCQNQVAEPSSPIKSKTKNKPKPKTPHQIPWGLDMFWFSNSAHCQDKWKSKVKISTPMLRKLQLPIPHPTPPHKSVSDSPPLHFMCPPHPWLLSHCSKPALYLSPSHAAMKFLRGRALMHLVSSFFWVFAKNYRNTLTISSSCCCNVE